MVITLVRRIFDCAYLTVEPVPADCMFFVYLYIPMRQFRRMGYLAHSFEPFSACTTTMRVWPTYPGLLSVTHSVQVNF